MTDSKDFLEASELETALKPFGLVKFFSFTALVFFLVSTIILVWIISNHTKTMLQKRSEAYALVLAENLNHQVFQNFVLPTLIRFGSIALRNEDQFERLDAIVRNTTHGLNMQSVTIFDREEGIVSYSTIPERVGKIGLGNEEYHKALAGQNNSVLTVNGSLKSLLPGGEGVSCQLKTYIPFRQEKLLSRRTGPIMGVFEIVQDLSGDYEALIRLQGVIIGTSVIIMSGLFVVLWLIVARADKIIAQRATERGLLEEKLNHAERLAGLGKMVASVSHEIKNPLGIVRSTAEILEKRLKKLAPENDHLARIIIEETSRLDRIVREFLDFARPQQLKLTPVSVPDLLLKALSFMARDFEQHKITLVTEIPEQKLTVAGDQDRLYQSLLNILMNAVQAMPGGGKLVVRALVIPGRKNRLALEISDTGKGMSAKVKEQIYTPFFTDKTRGTGLGMSIVKNIVAAHKGEISFESEVGAGTTFRIELPLS